MSCYRAFEALVQLLPTTSYGGLKVAVSDEAGRFQVWGGNIGAFNDARSPSSLDSRLKHAELMWTSCEEGLEDLEDAIQRGTRLRYSAPPPLHRQAIDFYTDKAQTVTMIVSGRKENGTEGPSLSTEEEVALIIQRLSLKSALNERSKGKSVELTQTELGELLLTIQRGISHLFTLSMLIRRDRPRGRARVQDLQRSSENPAPDINHVKAKFPKLKDNPWLADRIGYWTTQQRAYIRYRQAHRKRLAQSDGGGASDQGGRQSLFSSNLATTKATTFLESLVGTSGVATSFDDMNSTSQSLRSDATSFAPTTAASGILSSQRIPKLTDMWLDGNQLGYDKPIECPYCRTIQVFRDPHQWKYVLNYHPPC